MRIGQLTDVYKPVTNGVTNFVSLHKRTLEQWGHQVTVFTLGHEDYADEEPNVIRSPAIPLLDTGYHFHFRFCRHAREQMGRMDILHVHHPFVSGQQALAIRKRYGIPVVFTNHTRYHLQARYYLPFIPEELSLTFLQTYLPRFMEQCDLVVAPSQGVKHALRQLGVTCPIEVIPNGIEVTRFRNPPAPLTKSALGLSEKTPVAITVGRLGPEKNLAFLLRVMATWSERLPELHLLVIGDGAERRHLMEMIQLMGLGTRVHLVGAVPYSELPNWLAAADFFVIASTCESHPLALLEALAAGLPAVGIPSPGIEDTIRHGHNGFLSPEDAEAFGASVYRLATDQELRTRLAACAQEQAKMYDIRHTSEKLLAHYQRLVEERKPLLQSASNKRFKRSLAGMDQR